MHRLLFALILALSACTNVPDDVVIKDTKGNIVYTGTITHHKSWVEQYLYPVASVAASAGTWH